MRRVEAEVSAIRIGILALTVGVAGDTLVLQGGQELTNLINDKNENARVLRADPYEVGYWEADRTLGRYYLVENALKTLEGEATNIPALGDSGQFRGKIEAIHRDPVYQVARRIVDERRGSSRQADQDRKMKYDSRMDQLERKINGGAIITVSGFIPCLGAVGFLLYRGLRRSSQMQPKPI